MVNRLADVETEFKQMKLQDSDGGGKPRLLVIFYTLPEVIDNSTIEMSFAEREFNSTLSAVRSLQQNNVISSHLWIGCSTKETNDMVPTPPQANYEEAKHCVPVDITPQLFLDFVHGFCKGVIWPLFHSHLKDVNYDRKFYQSYIQANQLFCDKIVSVYRPGDLIWVHGYQLMLLPRMLRERLAEASIGWFLHAAFPSYEIFRVLPCREALLEGILESNLIGFQTYSTTSEFLQCCTRLLGSDATIKEVQSPSGHSTMVDVYPIGIDPKEILSFMQTPKIQQRIQELRKSFAGKKIIVARDRLEKSNGVIQKLAAVEVLLETNPSWHGNLVYLQICEPVTSQAEQEMQSELAAEVFEVVGRINGKYGRVGYIPVELYNQRIKKEEICALYAIADVALVTPLRAGMNTDVHEYVTCRGSCSEEDVGVVVVSEFAGSARCFCGALIVNPYSKAEVASALHEALTMPEDEKFEKHKSNWNYVRSQTCNVWADAFLSDLAGSMKPIHNSPLPRLDFGSVKAEFQEAKKRLILLDYDGTLTPIIKDPKAASPPASTINVLKRLTSDERNKIYVISGRDSMVLEKWLGNLNIGLCCEHGSFVRDTKDSNWVSVTNDVINTDWQDSVLTLMKYYEERTPGAEIEAKQSSIAWHYRNADPQYSTYQATELMSHLKGVSAKYPVDVLWGNKVIEARASGVNKGTAARRLMSETNPDFVLCIGDDKTDEDMFIAVGKSNPNYFTAVVKRRPGSNAKAYIRDQREVISLLQKLAEDIPQQQPS